jgi:hypothetical protein
MAARYRIGKKHPKRKRSRCGMQDKIRFPTERIANKALNTIWRAAIHGESKGEKMPCRAYGPCKRCRGWHLTSEAKRAE